MSDKIRPAHLERRAAVYVRQSTLRQVLEHPESTRRQYALGERALALGWRADAVDVVDDDLGQSGADALRRAGFRRLCEWVARGLLGAVLVLELSRLARSSADWHRLLDLCGVADVLLIDEKTVYHPADANDRLLLGIQGTMSEAERGWIRMRLQGARLSKARRGDFRLAPPAGYVWDQASSRLRLDPDAEVQAAVRLAFERFGVEQSAYGVARYFVEHKLRLPSRSPDGAALRWAAPSPDRIVQLVRNPTYAGAYVFGRRTPRATLDGERVVRRSSRVPPEAWSVVHRDHHPAYLSWDQFMANRRTLTDNLPGPRAPERHGAARAGGALLQGLVLCGRCGHRMHVGYGGRDEGARYVCASPRGPERSGPRCWSIATHALDRAVVRRAFAALAPAAVELSVAVMAEAATHVAALDRQRSLALERARYEARLTERRYKQVDPDNRTVARALEGEWEAALAVVERLEREQEGLRAQAGSALTPAERVQLGRLGRDVEALWAAPTTTNVQRKAMLRTLVREACARPAEDGGAHLRVLWQTGAVSELSVPRPKPGVATAPAIDTAIRQRVAACEPAAAIAEALNGARQWTAKGHRWTAKRLHLYCHQHGIRWPRPMPSSQPKPSRRSDGLYSTRGVAERFHVTHATVLYWVKQAWLTSVEGQGRGRAKWYRLDAGTVARLRQVRDRHTGPRGRTTGRPS